MKALRIEGGREGDRRRDVRPRVRHSGLAGRRVPARCRRERPDVARAHGEARRVPLPGPGPPGLRAQQPPAVGVAHRDGGPRRRAHRDARPGRGGRTSSASRGAAGSPTPCWTAIPELVDRVVIDGAGVLSWWAGGLVLLGIAAMSPFLHTRPVTALFSGIIGMDEAGRRTCAPRHAGRSGARSWRASRSASRASRSPRRVRPCSSPARTETVVRASNAALASLMPHAVARFAPGLGHGWVARAHGPARPDGRGLAHRAGAPLRARARTAVARGRGAPAA